MSKRFFIAILAIIVVAAGAYWLARPGKSSGSNAPATNHIMGTGSSGVTLTEYGDYQCPACEQYYPVVKQVVSQYQDRIHFQFRNLPLLQIHQNAFAGARAAEAAALQGKFWEMHDKLYDVQNEWSTSNNPYTYFKSYATELKLNTDQFKKDYESQKVNDTINADIAAFTKTGNPLSTPSFFIDGKKIDNPNDLQGFTNLLDAAISKKTGKPTGTTAQPAPADNPTITNTQSTESGQ
jgi:protein-disulfide isomerase